MPKKQLLHAVYAGLCAYDLFGAIKRSTRKPVAADGFVLQRNSVYWGGKSQNVGTGRRIFTFPGDG